MTGEIEEILEDVLRRITPEKKERDKIRVLSEKLERKVASASSELSVKVKVRVEGSVAKDTWIGEEPDIDIFMRVAKTIPRKSLGDVCLRIARKATAGSKQIERFAEHPYLEAVVDGTRVNIVPCYEVKQGEWLSATDRTPFHTDYMKKHLNVQMQAEVRLLKKFMKGIGVYGAEIKIGGFSGYLCELLILHYKSFMDTLKAFAQYRQRMVIDIEGFFKSRQREIDLLFDEPLVVVDPVDKARNVASAVRVQRLYTLVAAAQVFLKKPSFNFFYPPKTAPLSAGKMRQELKNRGSAIVFVTLGKVDAVPDILWGQLYKSQRSLRKLVELSDFKVLRDLPWSDEKGLNMFVFELEHCWVSSVKMHLGPPLEKEKECERFIAKHQSKLGTVSGPYVEDGRWVVLVRRKFTDASMLLREKLKEGGRNTGVAEQISHVLKKEFKVLVNEEIIDIYEKNRKFAAFLTEFLLGKPKWLEAAER
jgi:tRNA nucleotidyltransferase (CCA-adding enzyme)